MDRLLAFDGRIRRMGWWIAGTLVSLVSGSVNEARQMDDVHGLVVIILSIAGFILWLIGLSISVRRWHDLDKSGWWLMINLIPVIGWIYSFVMLGFIPGDQGSNSYGPPPQEGQIL